ncbi:response regulator [Maricaulis sp.]|uniref:response regulator n=1 Tax=Maricaulis sp. TaxID=1486257 RepID=UPI003297BC7D
MLDGLRILVVEDIPSIRSLIARLLERLGCGDVYAVGNIADAFTYLDTLGFDAVLLDYELEHENGLSLVRRLRRDASVRNHHVSVIVLTGHTETAVMQAAVQSGANSYLVKPVKPERLGERILDVLSARNEPRPGDDPDAPDRPDADTYWVLEG